jgi:hypothetical protein
VVNDAHFISVDFRGQLIGLGEYLAMYLFVWSDVLWPGTLPSFNEIEAYFSSRINSVDAKVLHGEIFRLGEGHRDSVTLETARTFDFGRTVKDVRRALANIPSYMIFDDHEITDDWNMTLNFCKAVYGSKLGLRIVQNGLVAYALCQHWGNCPEQFRSATSISAGEKLLLLLDGTNAANTDTRTWRFYPRGADGGGDFLPNAQLQSQIVKTDPLCDRALLVVLSTNAPAAQPVRTASRRPNLTRRLSGYIEHDWFPDLYESWEMPRNATDRLFKAISDKMPIFPFADSRAVPAAGPRRAGR